MKNVAKLALACAAALLVAGGPAYAHHSMVAEFNLTKPVTLHGTLTKLEWVNPHGWIYVDVKNAEGLPETWKVETGSPFRMEKRGLHKTDFKVGDEVIINGFASRDGSLSAAGLTITFPEREKSFPAREATFILGR